MSTGCGVVCVLCLLSGRSPQILELSYQSQDLKAPTVWLDRRKFSIPKTIFLEREGLQNVLFVFHRILLWNIMSILCIHWENLGVIIFK